MKQKRKSPTDYCLQMRLIVLKLKLHIYNSKMCFNITKAYLESNEDFVVTCLGRFWSKEDTPVFKNT